MGESKNMGYNQHEMYFGLKFRRLFKSGQRKQTQQNSK